MSRGWWTQSQGQIEKEKTGERTLPGTPRSKEEKEIAEVRTREVGKNEERTDTKVEGQVGRIRQGPP